MKQIVNFSGGKDSTAMLHLMLEKGERIDDVIFFDGGWEWPQMYDHIKKVEEKTGIQIKRLTPEKDFSYWCFQRQYISPKHGHSIGYGWPHANARWCTRLKIDTIKRYLRTIKEPFIQCVGFAVGEERRTQTKEADGKRFPLIEYDYDEKECLFYCEKLGYTWGGLYEYFDRVSCFCCPLGKKIYSSRKGTFQISMRKSGKWIVRFRNVIVEGISVEMFHFWKSINI